jgi:capsular polysaccharide biosynthesis protein
MPPQVKFVLHYLQIPFRRPRLLLALTALPVIMALIFTTLSPSPYQTSAVVALIKTRTDVTFDERIRTVTGEDPVTTTRSSSSVQDRANELAALVENGAIATDVIVRLKDQLPEAYRDPQVLVGKINATVMNPGGMIAVTAVDSDPEMAALLASSMSTRFIVVPQRATPNRCKPNFSAPKAATKKHKARSKPFCPPTKSMP